MLDIIIKTRQQRIQQLRIVPRTSFYVVEVIYEQAPIQVTVDPALRVGQAPR